MKGTTLSVRTGLAIRKRREALGIRQDDVARKLKMHRTYYSAIERGQKNLRIQTLNRICSVLNLQTWQIMQDAEK
jgi:transcriptional regulator with XRE-family HTH domain